MLTHSQNTFFDSEPPQDYVKFKPAEGQGYTPCGWYRVNMIEEELQVK